MKLLTSFYDPKNDQRNAELMECWHRNNNCAAFDQVYRFLEDFDQSDIMELFSEVRFPKDVLIYAPQRMTYRKYFEFANGAFDPGTVVCVANSDIWFDETLLNITDAQMDQKTFFALSRWGYMEDRGGWHWDAGYDRNGPVSQDAWIFRTPITWGNANLDFTTGCMRCDNVLAHSMLAAGYRVVNPTSPGPKSLVLRHEHKSQKHNYGEVIPGAMIFVHPCQLG